MALTLKRLPNGMISIYGLGKFPVTVSEAELRRMVSIAPKLNHAVLNQVNENASAIRAFLATQEDKS